MRPRLPREHHIALIAAERTGRRARAIEIDPHYVDVAVRRWQRSGRCLLSELVDPSGDVRPPKGRQRRDQRLIVNIPPRHLKSICASVALPAFLLGHDPTRKVICVSYADDDLKSVWTAPTTDARLKKRVVASSTSRTFFRSAMCVFVK
jgi:hypothetical protein